MNLDINRDLDVAFSTGAFLVSGDNVMTASWGFVGVIWGKKIFITPVRESRYTKTFIDKNNHFTISIPEKNTLQKAISICGIKSGRDCNKWEVANIEKQQAKQLDESVVKGCSKYFECRVLYKMQMKDIPLEGCEKFYPTKDMHTLYFGEIIEEY